MSNYYYILLLFLFLSCSADKRNENIHVKSEDTESITEDSDQLNNTEVEYKKKHIEIDKLEKLMTQKLQDIVDLNAIIKDTTIPAEMREQALSSLRKILLEEESLLPQGDLKNVQVIQKDSNALLINFKIGDSVRTAKAIIKTEQVTIEGKQLEQVEVMVKNIK